jgi:pilus assembly protein FimV
VRKPAFNTFLFLATVIFTGALDAAGLGKLTVNSTLGQPFKAEIDLVAVKREERFSLAARLASRDIFRLARVDYSPSLSTFKASIESRPDGQPYIKVVSAQPVAEPLLNMLIELTWSSGRLLREYAVLLPMAEADASETSAARSSSSASSSSDRPPSSLDAISGLAPMDKMERVPGKQLQETAGEDKARKGPAGSALSLPKGNTVYGPVKQGETLGGIVKNITPPPHVSFNQMLIALQRANSNAFLDGNIHQLKAGPILRIPDLSEIKAINRMEADKEVNAQTMEWHRQRSPDVTGAIVPADELKQTVSGKIAAADPDPASAEPREVLRLSRGEELPGNGIHKNGMVYQAAAPLAETMPGGWDKLRMMEEDAIAGSGFLLEANERIALLEKSISELQRLLQLRRMALAELQKPPHEAAGASAAAGASSIPTGFQSSGEGISHSGAAPQFSFSSPAFISMAGASTADGAGVIEAPSAADSSLVEIAGSAQASPLSSNKREAAHAARSSSLIEDLTRNIEYLGGAIVLLIMGITGFSMSRRPRKMPFAQGDTGKAVNLPESLVEAKAADVRRHRKESMEQSSMASDAMGFMAKKVPDDPEAGSRKADREQYAARGVPASNLSRSLHTVQSLPLSPVLAGAASSMVPLHPAMREAHPNISEAPRSGSAAWYRQGKAAPWHEIVNKIDLARAYQEMGDNEAAEQVLQEIMREGDIRQQTRAKTLLSNL